MDSNITLTAALLGGIWWMTTRNKAPSLPSGPGPVKNPNPTTMPATPLSPAITPVRPPLRPLSGTCFGVTDHAYPPFSPNVKNTCKLPNTFGWNLVNNPRTSQCQYYVGPNYVSANGGCIIPNQPGGSQTMFLLVNSAK